MFLISLPFTQLNIQIRRNQTETVVQKFRPNQCLHITKQQKGMTMYGSFNSSTA